MTAPDLDPEWAEFERAFAAYDEANGRIARDVARGYAVSQELLQRVKDLHRASDRAEDALRRKLWAAIAERKQRLP